MMVKKNLTIKNVISYMNEGNAKLVLMQNLG